MTGQGPWQPPPARPQPPAQPLPAEPVQLPPAPQPAAPPAGTPERNGLGIVVALLLLAVMVLTGALLLPRTLPSTVAADPTPPAAPPGVPDPLPGGNPEQGTASTDFSAAEFLSDLNAALAATDRAAFFAHIAGSARGGATLWWDNMQVLGMTGGALSVDAGSLTGLTPGKEAQVTVRLGAITAGTPRALVASDYAERGDYLLAAAQYDLTVTVADDGVGAITAWAATAPAKPWDSGPLSAVQTEHALVAGPERESDLVATAGRWIEASADWVLQRYASGTGSEQIGAFTVFVSDDEDLAGNWFQTGSINSELAGFTVPLLRPTATTGLDPAIATDDATTWGSTVITVGPAGVETKEAFQSLLAHELTHAVDFAAIPVDQPRSRVVSEGWAEYNQELWDSDGRFAPAGSWRAQRLQECLANGWGYPTDADFDLPDESITCAYVLSASVYAYAEQIGIDPFALSAAARRTGDSLTEVSEQVGSEPISEAGWQEWVRAHDV